MPSSRYERAARLQGYSSIAGVDEAGRGAVFGPVFAAAVVLDPARQIRGLDDSKQLLPRSARGAGTRIQERAVAWAVAGADALKRPRSTSCRRPRLAMKRAVERLRDGDGLPADRRHHRSTSRFSQRQLIHGDSLSFRLLPDRSWQKSPAMRRSSPCGMASFPATDSPTTGANGTPDHLAALENSDPPHCIGLVSNRYATPASRGLCLVGLS